MSFGELLGCPGVEERLALAGTFGFLAFHGGLESGTAELAADAADAAGASLYMVIQPPSLRWHIPSHRVDPAASELLRTFLTHVEVAVALHGYGRPDRPTDLLLGGTNRHLATHIAGHLRARLPEFAIVDDLDEIPNEMRGVHPHNPVNRASCGGVQLELPPAARGSLPSGAANGRRRPVSGLAEALAEAAVSWSGGASAPGRPGAGAQAEATSPQQRGAAGGTLGLT